MKIELSEEFAAPAAEVWKIVGAFYGLEAWFPGVVSCDRDADTWGEVRLASLGGRSTPERLEFYDNAGMCAAWSLVDAPLLGEHRSTLTVRPVSEDRCRAEWVFYADTQPPLNAEKIEENTHRLYAGALAAVKARVEKKSS